MILKNKEGNVRLVWRFFLLVAPFLLTAFLLRYIPIRIHASILIRQGLPESQAVLQARNLFLVDPIGASILGIIQGLLWYGLVYLLVRYLEKKPFSMGSFGLLFNGSSLVLMIGGFILGLMMYFSYYAVSSIFDRSPVVWSSGGPGIFLIALISLDVLFNGFGEETAFRAYWQRLIVHRHGLWPGIIIASISFVLLHLLITHLTVIALLAGIFVACLFGILYVWTGLVFLVGTLHATLNLAPRLLGPWSSDLSLLVINGLVLIIAVILYLLSGKGARAKMILSG